MLEVNSVGVLDKMMDPDDCMSYLEKRIEDRQDFATKDPGKLKLTQTQSGANGRSWGVKCEIDGQELPFSSTAIASACKFMGANLNFFNRFPDAPGAFMASLVDLGRQHKEGIVLRTATSKASPNTREIIGILPGDYDVERTDYEMVSGALMRIANEYGDNIQGIQILDDRHRATQSYRVVFGEPVLEQSETSRHKIYQKEDQRVYPMINLITSEIGATDTVLSLGLYRVICSNGIVQADWESCFARFDNRSNYFQYTNKMGEVIGRAGHFASSCGRKFRELMNTDLKANPVAIAEAMLHTKNICKSHFDLISTELEFTQVNTEYDMLNVITDKAKSLKTLPKRNSGENAALRIALQPGSFSGLVSNGFDNKKNKAAEESLMAV